MLVLLFLALLVAVALFQTPQDFSQKVSIANQTLPLKGAVYFSAAENAFCNDCNVVIIALDSLRADHLGAYGYHRNTSLNIDAFAKKSVLFENAYSQSAWTAPNYASLFTSRYPQSHGLILPSRRYLDSEVTLAEILKKYGYETAGFVGGLHMVAEFGHAQGFDIYDDNNNGHFAHMPINRSITGAIEWLEEKNREKFFLFIHGFDTHCPYLPEEGDENVFANLSYKPLVNVIEECDNTHYLNATNEDTSYVIDLYDDRIFNADKKIGRFLDFLEEKGLFEDSVIIFLSDHGETFKENKLWPNIGHSVLRNSVLQMSLVFYAPNATPGRITHLTELVDVFPTVLDVLGIPINHQAQGKSRLALIAREEEDAPKGVVHSAMFQVTNKTAFVRFAIATKERKYFYWLETWPDNVLPPDLFEPVLLSSGNFSERLFDFENDEGDNFDLSSTEKAVLESHRELLKDWWKRTIEKNKLSKDEKWLGPQTYFN